MDFSNYLANAIVSATVRGTAYTSPSTAYLALFLSNPTKDDTGLEVNGASYARAVATFAPPVNGVSKNSSDIEYNAATTNWGTVTHVGIYDAETGGNLLYFTELAEAKNIETGDIFKIATDNLTLTLN